MTITAARLSAAMADRRIDQSALARGIGVTQGAISKILLGHTTNSRLMPKIASYLSVNLSWLLGMTEDPREPALSAPTDAPVHHVMLAVALPPEPALARMFEGLLRSMNREEPVAEQARLLARRLPIGLSQLQDLLPDSVHLTASSVTAEDRATHTAEPAR